MALLPSPRARGIALLLMLAGTLLTSDVIMIAVLWGAVLVPLLAVTGLLRTHARFVIVVLVPVAVASSLVWGVVVGAPPGAIPGSAPELGVQYATMITFRLALLGALAQLAILSISNDDLAGTLRAWGIRGDGIALALGCLAVAPELKLRAEQITIARYAAGLLNSKSVGNRLRQVPHVLLPLVAWTLRSAIQRAESWRECDLLSRIEIENSAHRWQWIDIAYLALAIWWFFSSIGNAVRG